MLRTMRVNVWMAAAGIVLAAASCGRETTRPQAAAIPLLGSTGAASTSRADLERTVAAMRARVASNAGDAAAAVTLADALLRQARVTGHSGLAIEAEGALVRASTHDPERYDLKRMLAAVFASQHRFREAIRAAEQCLSIRQDDAWVYGALGDAQLELGEYEAAFNAFDRMNRLKPNAASYARASYARQLQGDLAGARRLMQMAAEATSPSDPESLAWHHAQLGDLWLEDGRAAEAEREFRQADYIFPGHPFAGDGLVRVQVARGDAGGALALLTPRLTTAPTPADFALAGDLSAALQRADDAERYYRLAETSWRSDVPEPTRLARFLAERGRHLDEAVSVAAAAWAERKDIFTADALAWAHFRSGRRAEATAAIGQARRTGTRDRVILYHAAAIAQANGHIDDAQRLLDQALTGAPRFDLIAAPAAAALRGRPDPRTMVRR